MRLLEIQFRRKPPFVLWDYTSEYIRRRKRLRREAVENLRLYFLLQSFDISYKFYFVKNIYYNKWFFLYHSLCKFVLRLYVVITDAYFLQNTYFAKNVIKKGMILVNGYKEYNSSLILTK